MPEVTNANMNLQELDITSEEVGPLSKQYNLFLGIWPQFCYVGAQVVVPNYFISFCVEAGYKKAFYLCLCFIFALAVTLTTGHKSVALLILVLCFESVRLLLSPFFSNSICILVIF